MNVALIVLAVTVALVVVIESTLRLLFGFGNPLIYIADDRCGYLLAPNQSVRRFGNRIEINQYSMRSPAITPMPEMSVLRVLLLGDSVANGGWWTDREDIISEIMARLLRQGVEESRSPEVLNASANSWGPHNQLAYLQKFGDFGAHAVVLLINTDDLFARAPNSWVVGRDRNYPDRKPPSAIVEILSRYLLPSPPVPQFKTQTEKGEREDIVGFNLEAISKIKTIVASTNAQFLLGMTPLLREMCDRHPRDYEIKARTRLAQFTQNEQIAYLDFLPIFKSFQQPTTLYRDNIHLTPQGNQLVSQTLTTAILHQLSNC